MVAHLVGRRAEYPEDTATGVGGGLEYYRGNGRLAYELLSTRLQHGDSGTAHVVHADWYYGEENRVGVAAAIGDEATRLSPDEVIVTDVRSVALAGRHWLHQRWGLAWAATWTEQGDFHTRTGGTLGILFRF
jgi:YaiO family outer membrane protein